MRELFERFVTDAEFRQWALVSVVLLTVGGNFVVWYEMTKHQQWRRSYVAFLQAAARNPLCAFALFSPIAALLAAYLFLHGILTGGVGDMPAAKR